MDVNRLVGAILIGLGLTDPLIGMAFVLPKIENPKAKKLVLFGFLFIGAAMISIGVALLQGRIKLP